MHGSAEERVGMGDDGGEWCVGRAGVEQGLEAAGGAIEIGEGLDGGEERHKNRV